MDSAESLQGERSIAGKCEVIDPLARFLRSERPGRRRSSSQAPVPADVVYAKLLEGLSSGAKQLREYSSRNWATDETIGSSLMEQTRSKLYDMITSVQDDIVQCQQYERNPSDMPPSEKVLSGEKSAEAQSSKRLRTN